MALILIEEEELERKLQEALDKALKPVLILLRNKVGPEQPVARSVVMQELKIKDVRTFDKRVSNNNAKSVGKIGSEPAYYMSQFFKKAS